MILCLHMGMYPANDCLNQAILRRANISDWKNVEFLIPFCQTHGITASLDMVLFRSVIDNKPDMVRLLLQAKASPYFLVNLVSNTNEPLQQAAIQHAGYLGHWDCVKIFLEFNEIDPVQARYGSPLCNGARANRTDIVTALLNKNTRNFNFCNTDHHRYTAIDWAVEYENVEMLQQLLAAGNNIEDRLIKLAFSKKNPEIIALLPVLMQILSIH